MKNDRPEPSLRTRFFYGKAGKKSRISARHVFYLKKEFFMAKKEKQPYHIVTFTFPEESTLDGIAEEFGGTVTRTDEEL